MNLKIKVYCILLTIAYLAIIINSAYQGSADFMKGLKKGASRDFSTEVYFTSVTPDNGKFSFPETIINEKNKQPIPAEVRSCLIQVNSSYSAIPSGLKIVKLTCIVFMAILVFGLLFSPLLFFSIIYSVSKNRIITSSLILRAKVLGWQLLLFSMVEIIYSINDTLITRHIVKPEGYSIDMGQPNYMMLILGLVILILAEILKVSLKIKEEQDLTI